MRNEVAVWFAPVTAMEDDCSTDAVICLPRQIHESLVEHQI
jgi:hypothetical protein